VLNVNPICCPIGGGGEGGAGALALEPCLQALEAGVMRINQALGLSILVKNDEANLRKVREAAAAMAEAGFPSHRVGARIYIYR